MGYIDLVVFYHRRQYLPPFEQQAAPAVAVPTNQYLPPAHAPAPAPVAFAAEPVFAAEPAAASFNEVDGYNYNVPQ